MNSFEVRHKIKFFLFLLAASGSLVLSTSLNQAQSQPPKTETKSSTRWEWSDDGWRRRVEIHGKAEFNEDYSDVSGLSEGGFLRLEEDQKGESHRLEVRRDENGQLVRKYYVNGEVRALDANGKKWVAGLLLTAVRQGAIDTDKRVKTILRQRGIDGILEEIASIEGEYAKRIYFRSLLNNEGLSRGDLQKTVAGASTQITSDHEKANLLKESAELFLRDSALSNYFFKAVSTIDSDYEHRQMLSALLKKNNLSESVLAQMLDSLAGISSDYEKANFLLEASHFYTGQPRLRHAFLKATDTIGSEHERGRVLSALLRNKQIG